MMAVLTGKQTAHKKCAIKQNMKLEDYKKCLESNKTMRRSQQRFKSELHNVFTEKVNKIFVSASNDKRLQALDRVISYPYGGSLGGVYKAELMRHSKLKN